MPIKKTTPVRFQFVNATAAPLNHEDEESMGALDDQEDQYNEKAFSIPTSVQSAPFSPVGMVTPHQHERLANPDAEQVLCAWFLSTPIYDDVTHLRTASYLMDFLTPSDFSQVAYKNIFTTIQQLFLERKPCSPTAVIDLAAISDLYVGTLDDLGLLQRDPIAKASTEAGLMQDAQILRDHAGRRLIRQRLESYIDELSTKTLQDSVTAINDEAQAFDSLVEKINAGPEHISQPMAEVVTHLMTPADESKSALRTGLRDLDAATNGGLRDGEFWLVAGRPGMGKTALTMGLGRNIAVDHTHNRPVLFFSLEMSAEALASRSLSSESGVAAHFLRKGGWTESDPHAQQVLDVLGRFQDDNGINPPLMRVYFDDRPGLSLAEIRSTARQFIREHKHLYDQAPLIIIDYIQIIQPPKEGNFRGEYNANQSVGKISQGLKALARELETPVIALSQLSRDVEKRTNKRPMPSDLRESGSLEQDADVILFVYRDGVYNPDADPTEAEIIIGKQREGKTGVIPVIYRAELVRFENSYHAMQQDSD